MLKHILHVGITVSDLEKSICFYRDVLGLHLQGQLTMKGEATDKLFNAKNCVAKIAYLNGSSELFAPPIELIEFNFTKKDESNLLKTSISEVCFCVNDIDKTYENLRKKGVEFLSTPQLFDFSNEGFGVSKVVYFKDPDGIILELIETIK